MPVSGVGVHRQGVRVSRRRGRTLFYQLEEVAKLLQKEAADVLDLVVKNDQAAARARVPAAMTELRPLRKQLSQTMQTIYGMQSQFVDLTGAVI